ncbi:MAG: RnfABCDGE type electron transport complex subunit B [Methanocellales archaeon]|nr:RnfABCDGE type electron transport complex subunit B [Methanocellales archaeon]
MAVLGIVGLGCSMMLVWASRKFHVEIDPKMEAILELLPGANCGACGYAGCVAAAERIAKRELSPNVCTSASFASIKSIGEIMGVSVEEKEKEVPITLCNGGVNCISIFRYDGVEDCRAAMLISEMEKACSYGCIGHGSCVKACPFDALSINEDGLPVVDEYACRGCGLCVDACPKGILVMAKLSEVYVLCSSQDKGKYVKEICEFGCIGCGICVKACPSEAITLTNNLAVIDQERCNGCGICVEKCPRNAIGGVR